MNLINLLFEHWFPNFYLFLFYFYVKYLPLHDAYNGLHICHSFCIEVRRDIDDKIKMSFVQEISRQYELFVGMYNHFLSKDDCDYKLS